jgi:hypothetical protein
VRLLVWFALFACAFPLLGAGFGAPSVVVYPITSMGGNDPSSGGNIAIVIATKLTELGGISVKPPTPGTPRAYYLDAALALGADYYVTGFLSPVGSDNSLITQVVSTQSGSVVYSTTTNVRTYADAIAQADVIRVAILRHAGRGLAAFDAPPTAPSTSPSPLAKNGNVDLTKALRKRAKPTSTATAVITPSLAPTEAPTSPAGANATAGPTSAIAPRGHALVFAASGPLDEPKRRLATAALARELSRLGVATTTLDIGREGYVGRAREFCRARPETTLLFGSRLELEPALARALRTKLDVIAYDCASHIVGRAHGTGYATRAEGFAIAIDRAASATSALVVTRLFP